ncbi:MAG: HEAT repeat domain-containing protein, partial [Verrucomicrobiota bacterium]
MKNSSKNVWLMTDMLAKGTEDQVLAVIESAEFSEQQWAIVSPNSNVRPLATNPLVDELLDIFLQRKSNQKKEVRVGAEKEFFRAVNRFTGSEIENDFLRYQASVLMAKSGDKRSIDHLINELPNKSVSQRKKIAETLRYAPKGALPILVQLMRDDSSDVRSAAATAVLGNDDSIDFIKTYFSEVTRPATKLKPYELSLNYLRYTVDEGAGKSVGNSAARDILENSVISELQALALATLRYSWNIGDAELAMEFTDAQEAEVRRAAWYAIGRNREDLIAANVNKLLNDPSERVRYMLPFIQQKESTYVNFYFNKTEMQQIYDSVDYNLRHGTTIDPDVEVGLRKLLNDDSSSIRLDSSFALLASGKTLDPGKLAELLSSFPDKESIKKRVSGYLEENYEKLGKEYTFLINYIDPDEIYSSKIREIEAHFDAAPAELDVEQVQLASDIS